MKILFSIIALFLPVVKGYSQNNNPELNSIFEKHRLIGLTTLVVCNDSIIYTGNIGTADITRKIPVTDSTIFRVASISKTITATALMMLYDKGLFKLDDDVSDILGYSVGNPFCSEFPITPRMLLTHTSGMQDVVGYYKFLADIYLKKTPPSLISLFADTGIYYNYDLWREEIPGTYFTYANLNFGIIATLVEKLSGERFDVYCKRHIFDPLGITGGFNIQDIKNINNVATIYRMKGGHWQAQADNFQGIMPAARNLVNYEIASNAFLFSPAGGLRISARDLAKIMILYMNGGKYKDIRILQDSTVSLMQKIQWKFDGSNADNYYGLFRSWGLGFQITENTPNADIVIPGYSMIGHIGESYGLISDMFFNKEKHFGMIMITNGSENSFEFANHSAFYKLDEDVFSSLYTHVIAPNIRFSTFGDIINYLNSSAISDVSEKQINARFYMPSAGMANYTVFNSVGEDIISKDIYFDCDGSKQISIKTNNLAKGLYCCIIKSAENRKTFYFCL